MRYFKIPLCRNFAEILFEKSEIILDRMTRVNDVLGQKLGYDTNQNFAPIDQNSEAIRNPNKPLLEYDVR